MSYQGLSAKRHQQPDKVGVLMINLGTPRAPHTGEVRRYLRQFLSDPRVIELPRVLWWLLLNCVILPLRSPRSARAYRKIWTEQGSPLLVYSSALVERVNATLAGSHPERFAVQLGMSYGAPSLATAVQNLVAAGARRLVVLPLYPQYSGSTTGSVFDGVSKVLQRYRWVPDFRFISQYWQRPDYLEALAQSVREHWQQHGRGELLLLSFHGIPKRYFDNGDPYFCQCQGTARGLRELLGLSNDTLKVSFQSRVGREQWLRPYTLETVRELAAGGIKKLDVLCPGFAVDCLETLEEIEVENAEAFTHAGGEALRYIPALNAGAAHADLLAKLVLEQSQGWPEADLDFAPELEAQKRTARVEALESHP